jgi:TPR repeat protein
MRREGRSWGHARAQTSLGWLFENGNGVPQDYIKAEQLYRKAAEGFTRAPTNLGILYQNGNWVEKDLTKAAELYRKAADQGFAPAQTNLGVLYETGNGVEKDLTKAADLYQKAADQEEPYAQINLSKLYENGNGVLQDYTKAAVLRVRAAELWQKSADRDDPVAQNNLACLYRDGNGVPQDHAKAAELYQKAADQGEANAQRNLAMLYQKGTRVPKDLSRAIELYRKAADQGNQQAKEDLRRLGMTTGQATQPPATSSPEAISMTPPSAGAEKIPASSILGLTDIIKSEVPDPDSDAHLLVRITIQRRPDAAIDDKKVKIVVRFYDTVDDKNIKLTNADVSYEWPTPTHDWKHSDQEVLSLTYVRSKDKVQSQGGRRKYLGYITQLYYNDQLQDERADPETLPHLAPSQ